MMQITDAQHRLQNDGHFVSPSICLPHYGDVMMGAIASQIISLTIVYLTVYSDADQRKHQSSASVAFVCGIHRWPVHSAHKCEMASNAGDVSIWWRHHAVSSHSSRTGCFRWDYRSAASHRCVLCRVALAAEETGTTDSRYSAVEYIEHNLKWRKLNFVPVTYSEKTPHTSSLQLSHGNKYVQNFALFKISQTHGWKWPLFFLISRLSLKKYPLSRENGVFVCLFFMFFFVFFFVFCFLGGGGGGALWFWIG